MNHLPVKIRLYADDCVLYNEINSVHNQNLLNNSFSQFLSWSKKWQMEINFNKTVFMSFTNKKMQSVFSYGIGNVILRQVYEYKYLGILFTPSLKWDSHISFIRSYKRLK